MYDVPDSLSLTPEDSLILEHLILLDSLNETAQGTAEIAETFVQDVERAILAADAQDKTIQL